MASCGAHLALSAATVVVAGVSDNEPRLTVNACPLAGVTVEVYERSRLLQADKERLELVRGRTLGCQHPLARKVLAALAEAIDRFPRGRLRDPVRVHLDPRLPARQAALASIEVHVTSREVLVASTALDSLGAEVWRHELLHVLAARPPEVVPAARRLWLTLEEGVVEYLARPRDTSAAPAAALDARGVAAASVPLPALELLTSPAYDPHPLARGLSRELGRVEGPPSLDGWLSCLATAPLQPGDSLTGEGASGDEVSGDEANAGALQRPEALAQVLRLFTSRCSSDAASHLSAAIDRWWAAPSPERRRQKDVIDVDVSASCPESVPASVLPSTLGEAGRRLRVSPSGASHPRLVLGSQVRARHDLFTRSLRLSEPQ